MDRNYLVELEQKIRRLCLRSGYPRVPGNGYRPKEGDRYNVHKCVKTKGVT